MVGFLLMRIRWLKGLKICLAYRTDVAAAGAPGSAVTSKSMALHHCLPQPIDLTRLLNSPNLFSQSTP